ncbi:E3 ubiquitin-protein ligase TRIM38-like isoform X2 [Onychomys torridus]|uniref:E3 ubiquitin-protein ligase TRIM38-like isoform X2 n=1 Tax=Onychomys torridus TaxID=38674 RepID=UPI00167FA3E2|nr:E3 ubiquitin-protein ligase TRIM38-like isoform X2 [Onychomys torridus]
MGTSNSIIKMIKISSCSICKELMSHPVSINCGHSYCRACIQRYYTKVSSETGLKIKSGCPLCRSSFRLENLRPNKDLENIIDVIKEMAEDANKMLCKEHLEKLDLFCEDEGQLLCWRCNWEDRHKGHSVALVGDVCQDYKEKLQETVKKMGKLQENHKAQLCLMTEQINAWKDVKNTLSRFETVKLEPWKAELPKVHTTCNVSELYFDVKTLLRRHQVDVTLDPSTAHPDLALSKDRRQVTYKQCHKDLEASTERFYVFPCVLGCEDFTSGRYYFEVSVENATTWDVGVCIKDVPRGFDMKKEPEFGFWTIKMCKKDGLVALTSTPTSLHLSEKPQLVGVFLDIEAGVISFYNMTSGSHIFTFPKASFRDTLRPFFQVYEHSPLFLPARSDQGEGKSPHGESIIENT